MKKTKIFISLIHIALFVCGRAYGLGERTVFLGGQAGWGRAENRNNVTEAASIRPHPVLILSSAFNGTLASYTAASGVFGQFGALTENSLDLSLSFDEPEASLFRDNTGRYRVTTTHNVSAADRRFSRAGSGAALFGASNSNISLRANNPLVIEPVSRNALFAQGNRINDFTIEFWLFPVNMGNGEQIFTWVSQKQIEGTSAGQRIQAVASRNRLQWSFVNFFASACGTRHLDINFSSRSYIVPREWSHHLIRFDAVTGLLEYIINGSSEVIVYTTPSGREGSGEIHTPLIGSGGAFFLGERFTGMMDEFRIHSVFAGRSSLQRYADTGGRVETGHIDLGAFNSRVLTVNACGGRTGISNTRVLNEFRNNGRFRFSDASEISFFIRASNNPWLLSESQWISFVPGMNLNVIGRYVQLAFDFFPSADGEISPYLDEVRIVFMPNEPPPPPRNFTAVAVDGGVLLRWTQSINGNAHGYLIYYSNVRGEFFGVNAVQGSSPINAGKTNSFMISGLNNGTLYHFRIASYEYIEGLGFNIGEFSSREVKARPLAGLSLDDIGH